MFQQQSDSQTHKYDNSWQMHSATVSASESLHILEKSKHLVYAMFLPTWLMAYDLYKKDHYITSNMI
jgi:hypothetical protein